MRRTPFGAIALARRQLATFPSMLLIPLIVALGTLLVTGVPRLIEQVGDDDLRETVAAAPPERANLVARSQTRVAGASSSVPFRWLRHEGERTFEAMPSSISSLITDQQFVFDTPSFRVGSFPDDEEGPFPTFFRFRYQEGLDSHMTVVEGSLPTARSRVPMLRGPACPEDRLAVDAPEFVETHNCEVRSVAVFEVALTEETALVMGVGVGDAVMLTPNVDDRLWFSGDFHGDPPLLVVVVSGLVELTELEDPYWYGDVGLHRPRITENADYRLIHATGIIRPEAYRPLLDAIPGVDFDYRWRYAVDAERIEGSEVGDLVNDLAKLDPPRATITTGLDEILVDFMGRRRLAVQVTSTGVVGLAVAVLASLAVFSLLNAAKLRPGALLARDRGAGSLRLLGLDTMRAVALVAPAAALGSMVAWLLVSEPAASTGVAPALLFTLGTLVVVVTAGLGVVLRPLGALRSRDNESNPTDPRVYVLQLLVLILAGGAVVLTGRRGSPDLVAGDPDFDALVAATPALLALAAGILTGHLAATVVRVLDPLVRRSRSLTTFVALRRVRSGAAAATAPVLVVVAAVGIAAFSGVVRTSITEGQVRQSWATVGADYRIEARSEGTTLAQHLDFTDVGLGEIAEVARFDNPTILGPDRAPGGAVVLAVEYERWLAVLDRSPLRSEVLSALGNDANGAVPALVSANWAADGAPAIGTRFDLRLGVASPEIEIVGVAEGLPSLGGEPFLVLDLGALREVTSSTVAPTAIYASGPPSVASSIDDAIGVSQSITRVVSRHDVADDVGGAPLIRWTHRGLAVVMAVSIVLAAVSAMAWVALTTTKRRRDVGVMSTLGLSRRGALRLVIVEHLPLAGLAMLAGLGVGVVAARVLEQALDLEVFTGQDGVAPIVVDPWSLVLVGAIVMITLTLAVLAMVFSQRDATVRAMLKIGDDP